MTMMCVRCYLEGRRVPVGVQVTKNQPFAFMVYEGESRCVEHIPAPAVDPDAAAAFDNFADAGVPEKFPPMKIVREPVQTDNRYVVEEGTAPEKAGHKKAPTKKRTPAKKAQQRKRIKS